MTGGIIENLFPRLDTHNLDELWSSLFKSYYKNSLMGCALEGEMFEGLRDDGLHALHAYIVTKMAVAMCKDGEKRLVRIKNPHGNNFKKITILFKYSLCKDQFKRFKGERMERPLVG